jgi:integration host factor subunit alpha
MMGWRHCGFNVDCGARIQPGEEEAIENLARYPCLPIFLRIPVPAGSHPKPVWKACFMTLTKAAITCSVFDRPDLSKAPLAKAVETTFMIIKKTFEDGEDVVISGFGKSCVKGKGKGRAGNRGTGEELMPAHEGVPPAFHAYFQI